MKISSLRNANTIIQTWPRPRLDHFCLYRDLRHRMDADIINVIIAVAVIYFVARWATGKPGNAEEAAAANNVARTLGFKPRKATPDMIESVRSAFPDIPTANIHYHLLRSGSVETTVNTLLERGYLDAPPAAYFRAFPATTTEPTTATGGASKPSASKSDSKPQSLIQRFHLESKLNADPDTSVANWDGAGPIPAAAKGKGRASVGSNTGASVWEATPEKRQESLQKRKEAMILAARKRMLEKEAAEKAAAS